MPPLAARIELTTVPFFPQTAYQCGPAALATVLAHAGVSVDADTLAPEVFVAGLKGSLQAELLGATRRHGFIPYVLTPEPQALLTELEAGRPVLVLENLGVKRFPVWHYAVVVGANAAGFILRSGTEPRRLERGDRFLRSWERAGSWAFVPVAPGELPASATAHGYVRALAGAQPLLPQEGVKASYDVALRRWPDDALVLFAAAGYALAEHDFAGATTLYRRVLAADPRHAAARNNLANALEAQGCHADALAEARLALATVTPGAPLYGPILETVEQIESAPNDAARACP